LDWRKIKFYYFIIFLCAFMLCSLEVIYCLKGNAKMYYEVKIMFVWVNWRASESDDLRNALLFQSRVLQADLRGFDPILYRSDPPLCWSVINFYIFFFSILVVKKFNKINLTHTNINFYTTYDIKGIMVIYLLLLLKHLF